MRAKPHIFQHTGRPPIYTRHTYTQQIYNYHTFHIYIYPTHIHMPHTDPLYNLHVHLPIHTLLPHRYQPPLTYILTNTHSKYTPTPHHIYTSPLLHIPHICGYIHMYMVYIPTNTTYILAPSTYIHAHTSLFLCVSSPRRF